MKCLVPMNGNYPRGCGGFRRESENGYARCLECKYFGTKRVELKKETYTPITPMENVIPSFKLAELSPAERKRILNDEVARTHIV